MSASGTKWSEIRPKKVWQVGDKTYPTYLEAVRALGHAKQSTINDFFKTALRDIIAKLPYADCGSPNTDAIADHLLERFVVKPRVK